MNPNWQAFFENTAPESTDIAQDCTHAKTSPILCPLPQFGLLRAEGEDAMSFLQNMGSNDLKRLAPGQAQWNSLNGAKGRMLANFLLARDEASYELILPAGLAAAIHKKLSMYVLRTKVKVSDHAGTRLMLGLGGKGARELLARAGLPAPADTRSLTSAGELQLIAYPEGPGGERFLILLPAEALTQTWQTLCAAGAQAAAAAWWEHEDILAGLPWITEATQDQFVAQMINFELIGGVSFQKGCYPGQEIIARTQHLGKLKKRTYLARAEATSVGQSLYAPEFGDQVCGTVLNATPSPEGGFALLAVLQTSAFEAGEVHLGTPDGARLEFGQLPYALESEG